MVVCLMLAACQPATEAPPAEEPAEEEMVEEPAEAEATEPPPAEEPAEEEMVEEPAEAEPMEEVIQLTYWNLAGSEKANEWWQGFVDDWNNDNPNIQVKMELFEEEAYRVKVLPALATGTTGDIFYSQPYPDIKKAVRAGKIFPIEGLVNKDNLDPTAISIMSVDGELAGMPRYVATTLMYYNKAAFAEAGVDPENWADPLQPTWEEFAAAADALKEAGITPIALGNAPNYPGAFYYWAFHHRFGGSKDLDDAIFGTNGGTFESEAFIRAGQMVQEIVERGWLPEGYNAIQDDESYTNWMNGDGAILYMGTWLAGYMDAASDDFEYGYFDFPSFFDGEPASQKDTLGGVEGNWVAASSEHPEAAAAFLDAFPSQRHSSRLFRTNWK